MSYDWTTAYPNLDTYIKEYPSIERTMRLCLDDALGREHTFPGTYGSTAGKHLPGRCSVLFVGTVDEISALSSPPQYSKAYATDVGQFYYFDGSLWNSTNFLNKSYSQTISADKVLSGTISFTGTNTFTGGGGTGCPVTLPATSPTEDTQSANKSYTDNAIDNAEAGDRSVVISSNDASVGYLFDKLAVGGGSHFSFEETDDGGNESITVKGVSTAGSYLEFEANPGGAPYAGGNIYCLVRNEATVSSYKSAVRYIDGRELKLRVGRHGTYRIVYDMGVFYFTSHSYLAYAKLYRNGIAIGTEAHAYGDQYSYAIGELPPEKIVTEDISGCSPGDIFQVYFKGNWPAAGNLAVYTGNPIKATGA